MAGPWGSGPWQSDPQQGSTTKTAVPARPRAAPGGVAAVNPGAPDLDLGGIAGALSNRAGSEINHEVFDTTGYVPGHLPKGAGNNHYLGTRGAPDAPFVTVAGGAPGVLGGPDANGFLPRGAPGYDLRPGQYGIDPNTAIIPRYGQWQGRLDAGAAAAGQRADTSPFRTGQMTLAQQLADQANGKGPSLAQGMLQQATDRNLSHAFALGQSLRGPSAGGQLRGIQNQQAGISQQSAMDAGQLRLQEQMAARGMLGNVLNAGRGGDHSQQAMNDNLVKFYTDAGLSLDQAQMRARMEMEGMRSNASLGLATLNSGNDARNTQMALNMASGAAQGLATYASAQGSSGGAAAPTQAQPVGYDAGGNAIYSQPTDWSSYPSEPSQPPPIDPYSGYDGGQL